MSSSARERRDLDGDPADWSLLERIERILAEPADEWDDGELSVTLTDAIGEHRGGSVEEVRAAFDAEGQGEVAAAVLEARGSAHHCRVELRADGSGSVAAETGDDLEAEDLAGAVERVVRRSTAGDGEEPAADRGEPAAGGAPHTRHSDAGEPSELPSTAATLAAIGVLLGALALLLIVSDRPPTELLREPWVITIGGGLLTIFIAWLVKRAANRAGDD